MKVTLVPFNERCHVEALSENDLNTLIDRYLFQFHPWCSGPAEFQYQASHAAIYKCLLCGATEERPLAGRFFDHYSHERRIPSYRLEDILAAMQIRDQKTQMQFILALRIAIDGPVLPRSPAVAVQHVLFAITPRLAAIAALNAVGVIDAQGYVSDRASVSF